MAFEIPTDLHPNLIPVAWLLGTWHGNGRGEYPGIDPFGFEQEIVKEILSLLPRDARLHTVGVGSSVNRSLTQPAARAD